MTLSIDLNCDLGEGVLSPPDELALLDIVSSANIACGGHAGDAATIDRLARACLQRNVAIGAHPSYPDRANFGRTSMAMSPAELETSLNEQLRSFLDVVRHAGAHLSHIKPHGALYHDAMTSPAVADAIAAAARSLPTHAPHPHPHPHPALVAQAGSHTLTRWRNTGFTVWAEAFADRVYEPSSLLRSRTKPGALLESPTLAAEQARRIVADHSVETAAGAIPVHAQTICLHSDTPGSITIARFIRNSLESAGIRIAPIAHP